MSSMTAPTIAMMMTGSLKHSCVGNGCKDTREKLEMYSKECIAGKLTYALCVPSYHPVWGSHMDNLAVKADRKHCER